MRRRFKCFLTLFNHRSSIYRYENRAVETFSPTCRRSALHFEESRALVMEQL